MVELVERVEEDHVGVGEDHFAIWADTQKVEEQVLVFSKAVRGFQVKVCPTFFFSSSPEGVEFRKCQEWNWVVEIS